MKSEAGFSYHYPKFLKPGDKVAVVAPSGSVSRKALLSGLSWLQNRYELCVFPQVFSKHMYLAGTDKERREALHLAMIDDTIKAIWFARGGFGSTRIVNDLPWAEFAKKPKWMIGFSDVTALHMDLQRLGICSIHASNVTGLGVGASPYSRQSALDTLEGRSSLHWTGLKVLVQGSSRGPLVGGNLSLLAAHSAPSFEGAIVCIEEVGEAPYRVDRMLTSLLPKLKDANAVVFGQFTKCDDKSGQVSLLDVLKDFAERLKKPCFYGAPFGHEHSNEAFILGSPAMIKEGSLVSVPVSL